MELSSFKPKIFFLYTGMKLFSSRLKKQKIYFISLKTSSPHFGMTANQAKK